MEKVMKEPVTSLLRFAKFLLSTLSTLLVLLVVLLAKDVFIDAFRVSSEKTLTMILCTTLAGLGFVFLIVCFLYLIWSKNSPCRLELFLPSVRAKR